MSQSEQDKQAKKAAMKKLREERKTFIKAASAKMKVQKKAIRRHFGSTQDRSADGSRHCHGNRCRNSGNTLVHGGP